MIDPSLIAAIEFAPDVPIPRELVRRTLEKLERFRQMSKIRHAVCQEVGDTDVARDWKEAELETCDLIADYEARLRPDGDER